MTYKLSSGRRYMNGELVDWSCKLFLTERCCHDGDLMHVDMRETLLQEFPRRSRTACRAAIQEVTEYGGTDLILVIAWAVCIERARRHAESSGF